MAVPFSLLPTAVQRTNLPIQKVSENAYCIGAMVESQNLDYYSFKGLFLVFREWRNARRSHVTKLLFVYQDACF